MPVNVANYNATERSRAFSSRADEGATPSRRSVSTSPITPADYSRLDYQPRLAREYYVDGHYLTRNFSERFAEYRANTPPTFVFAVR